MNDIDEALLMAYADGELSAADVARVEAAVAGDPAWAAALARHRALRARVGAAFAPILDEPVPGRLRAALASAPSLPADIVDSRAHTAPATVAISRRWRSREWLAMAACVLVGVALARVLPQAGAPAQALVDEAMLAQGALDAGLDEALASERPAQARVAVGLSFRARGGEYCRTFTVADARPLAGLACRSGEHWRVTTLTQAAPAPTGEMRTAASALPASVLADVDARIDGEPLDAAGERAARAARWR